MTDHDGLLDAAQEEIAETARREVQALRERGRLAILAAELASRLGMRTGMYELEGVTYVQMDLPSGQVRFPLEADDPEWCVFSPAREMVCDFTGDNDEKWTRIDSFICRHGVRSNDDVVLASFRETVSNLETALQVSRRQRQDSGQMYARARAERQDLRATISNLREVLISTGEVESHTFDQALKKAEKLTTQQRHESEGSEDK